MIKYPLYDELVKRVNQKPDKPIDTSHLCQTINAISLNNADATDHYEEIHALIIHYESITNSNILLTTTPFDGKVLPGNKGVLNTLIKIPAPLRKILLEYIDYYAE